MWLILDIEQKAGYIRNIPTKMRLVDERFDNISSRVWSRDYEKCVGFVTPQQYLVAPSLLFWSCRVRFVSGAGNELPCRSYSLIIVANRCSWWKWMSFKESFTYIHLISIILSSRQIQMHNVQIQRQICNGCTPISFRNPIETGITT